MISPDRMSSIEARLRAVAEGRWQVVTLPDGAAAIRVFPDAQRSLLLRVTREAEPAGAEQVEFIAHAPYDLRRLIAHLKGERPCATDELAEINKRVAGAPPAPWRAFLRSKGGVGGDSVIWVSEADEEPDLYLWIDSEPAPDIYFEFVAAARQDVADLLQEAQSQT